MRNPSFGNFADLSGQVLVQNLLRRPYLHERRENVPLGRYNGGENKGAIRDGHLCGRCSWLVSFKTPTKFRGLVGACRSMEAANPFFSKLRGNCRTISKSQAADACFLAASRGGRPAMNLNMLATHIAKQGQRKGPPFLHNGDASAAPASMQTL